MVASTLTVDPLEAVAAQFGDTPVFFQLYTPTDRELAQSFVQRAEAAGFKGIVVTLDTWIPGSAAVRLGLLQLSNCAVTVWRIISPTPCSARDWPNRSNRIPPRR